MSAKASQKYAGDSTMNSYRILGLWVLLLASPVFAEIVEKEIRFDNELGSAVLYYDDSLKQVSAGVVVVHEWWGMDDYTRSRARQLAEAGYSAVAVDMYGNGKVAQHPKDAKAFMNAALANPDTMNARFDAALEALASAPNVDPKRHFAIGYCFGGAVVLNQARRGTDLAGVASFHGSLGTEKPATTGAIKARLLVATGADDPMVPAQQVGDFVVEMSNAGAELELLSFPGVVHGFTNPAASAKGKEFEMPLAYDAHADARSWQALLEMLAR
jgi:dienelactone hydrolase